MSAQDFPHLENVYRCDWCQQPGDEWPARWFRGVSGLVWRACSAACLWKLVRRLGSHPFETVGPLATELRGRAS